MPSQKRLRGFLWLTPVLICLPCLLAPLAAVGGVALLSTLGGAVTGSLVVAGTVLVLGLALAGGLYAHRRRRAAACCAPEPANQEMATRPPAEVA